MPLPVMLAHRLALRLTQARKSGELSYLRPDGKTQVTVEYEGRTPVRVDTVVVSTQHDAAVSQEDVYKRQPHEPCNQGTAKERDQPYNNIFSSIDATKNNECDHAADGNDQAHYDEQDAHNK